jgi:hypothetical protein
LDAAAPFDRDPAIRGDKLNRAAQSEGQGFAAKLRKYRRRESEEWNLTV